MNKILFIVIFTMHCVVFTQEQYTVTGRFVNQQQTPIELAKISLYDSDSTIVNVEITDSLGVFLLSAQEGKYTAKLELLGVKYWSKTIELNTNIDLETVEIDETKVLTEITVTATKPLIERKIDRLVFNVENSVVAGSGTLLDALKITPGVVVNNNSISIIGRGNALILIDERNVHLSGESLINYLNGISTDAIQSIEVMTTPPVKYDAQGSGGIINIKYKKGRKNSWQNNIYAGWIQGFYSRNLITETFLYNKNKLSFDVHLTLTNGYDRRITNTYIDFPTQTWSEQGRTKAGVGSYDEKLNISYKLSEKSSIGAILSINQYAPPNNRSLANNTIIQNGLINGSIYTIGEEKNTENTHAANVNYDITFGKQEGSNVDVNLDYFDNTNKNKNFFNSNHTAIDKKIILHAIGENNSDLRIENYSAKVDAQHFGGAIQYGAKTSTTETNSKVGFFDMSSGTAIEDLTKNNKFKYKEEVNAAYMNLAAGVEQFNLQLGMRYEHTKTYSHSQQKDSNNKRDYKHFFPSAFLMYAINETDALNISYSKRIERPSFWEIDPFRMQINAYSYVEGNPFLQPKIEDNYELSYSNGKLYVHADMAIAKNEFTQFTRVDSITKIQAVLRDNFYGSKMYSFGFYYRFDYLNWLETQVQGDIYYATTSIDEPKYKDVFAIKNGTGGAFHLYNFFKNITKNNNFEFDVSYRYSMRTKVLMYDIKDVHRVDIGTRLYFSNRNIYLRLYVEDLFKTAIPDITMNVDGVKHRMQVYPHTQHVWIGIRYSIGNKIITKIEKEFGNQEEQERGIKN